MFPAAVLGKASSVPNEVYATAHRELVTMVSPRAAERVLDDALASVRVSRDAVTARQMRALITGPIQSDLRTILPRAGLNRVLRRIMDDLRAMSRPTSPETPAPRSTDARPTERRAAAPAVPESAPSAPGRSNAASPDVLSAASPLVQAAPTPVAAPLSEADLTQDALERIAMTFARVEHVVGVTVIRDGEAIFARGSGLDPDRAAVIVPVAATLLARRGAWRSYTLVHDQGQCFIIPVGRDFVVLVGRSEFNLGAVLTVLATLEEDL